MALKQNFLYVLTAIAALLPSCLQIQPVTQVSLEEVGALGYAIYAVPNEDGQNWTSGPCLKITTTQEDPFEGRSAVVLEWTAPGTSCNERTIHFEWNGAETALLLEEKWDSLAVSFQVRMPDNAGPHIPLQFGIADKNGQQVTAGFSSLGWDGGALSTQWRQFVLPLGVLVKNDQFSPELASSFFISCPEEASIVLDDLMLIRASADEYIIPVAPIPPESELPIMLFDEGLANSWQIGADLCSGFSFSEKDQCQGRSSIRINYGVENSPCKWNEFGFSWSKWRAVNWGDLEQTAALRLYIRSGSPMADVPLQIILEDMNGRTSAVPLTGALVEAGTYMPVWQEVRIPLTRFDLKNRSVDVAQLKQLRIRAIGDVFCYLDAIELVPFSGDPKAPFAE